MFQEVKALMKAGKWFAAFRLLRNGIRPEAPIDVQIRAARLCGLLPADAIELRPLKIALLANTTVDHFADVLRYWLATEGFAADIQITPFGTIVQTVLDSRSSLYSFQPDIVWLFTTYRDLKLGVQPGAEAEAVREAVASAVYRTQSLWKSILDRLKCIVLQNNCDVPAYDPFGNLGGASFWGERSAMRLYNAELTVTALPGVTIFDFDHLSGIYGKDRWVDDRYWFHSKHAFALDASGLVAFQASRLIAAAKGLAKKCLVLDLDNTLWGGVIGDDGIDGITLGQKAAGEAFSAFQEYARALNERGVILAVCSKNDEANAKAPFEQHPDMRLKLDNIAVFRANWNNKVDNIRDIAATLNIGLDSLVFVDDNPAERAIVRQFLPMVAVPEIPVDPSGYVKAVASLAYFEAASFAPEDRERARYYFENAKRTELQMSFSDTASYLNSLEMTATVGPCDTFHLPRMAQLINKSNQFHLTGVRYGEPDLLAMANDPDYTIRYFELADRFGDNGLISVVVLRQSLEDLQVEAWVMSCRVLGRSMEEFVCGEMLKIAKERNCSAIVGQYKQSPKNGLVEGLYRRLGFSKILEEPGVATWRLEVSSDYSPPVTYILAGNRTVVP